MMEPDRGLPGGELSATVDSAAAGARYTYQVQVSQRRAPWRRWRGRIVTVDLHGKRRYWRWRTAGSRDRLIDELWAEAMRDIRWRTGRASVEIVDVRA